MNRATEIAKLMVWLLLAAFLLTAIITTVQLGSEILEISKKFAGFTDHAVVLVQDTDDRVNEAHDAIVGVTPLEKKAGLVEDAALTRVNELHDVLAHAVPVEDAALARVNQLQIPITDAGKVLTDTRVAVSNANKAAIDERFYFETQVPKTMTGLDAAIAGLLPVEQNVASMTKHGDAVMGDVQLEADKIAHPEKKKLGFWGSVYAGAQVVHKLSPPLFMERHALRAKVQ